MDNIGTTENEIKKSEEERDTKKKQDMYYLDEPPIVDQVFLFSTKQEL